MNKLPFKKCPICNGEVVEKKVEKLLQSGDKTTTIRTRAEVCLNCGERLYSPDIIYQFGDIRKKLAVQ